MIDAVEGKAYNQLADAEMKQFSEGEAVALDFHHGSNNFTSERRLEPSSSLRANILGRLLTSI